MNVRKSTLIVLSLLFSIVSFAQHASIHGKVSSTDGQELIGNIAVKF